jgi:hypothetical protein
MLIRDLPPEHGAALQAIVAEPMRLTSEWETKGHRRQLFYFAHSASPLKAMLSHIVSLAQHGLVELHDDPSAPDTLIAMATARGAKIAARPPE